MNDVATRRGSPVSEMLEWLESNSPVSFRGLGLAPYVRVEDFLDGDTYVLRAELPGIDPSRDVDLEIDEDELVISGERQEETRDKNHRELHYGSFRRAVPLPRGLDPEQVTATYTDGVLEVRVPKVRQESASRKIPVTRRE